MIERIHIEITDEMLREMHRKSEQRSLKFENPFVFDIIRVLSKPPQLKRSIALDLIRSNRVGLGLEITPAFDETVQSALQYHCREAAEFRKRGVPETEALFCWPKGKGAGVWSLLRENTKRWLDALSYLK